MRIGKLVRGAVILAVATFGHAYDSAAQVERASLGLNGANVHNLATNDDGSLILAACQGPYGIFYSTDFGASWNDARDDVYTGGEGRGAVIFNTEERVYAVAGDYIYSSSTTTPLEWTRKTFSDGGSPFNPYKIAADGGFLFIGTRNNLVVVVDISTETVIETSNLPTTGVVNSIALDAVNGFIFVVVGESVQTQASIYRATYNPADGSIGSWSEKEPPAAAGYYTFVSVAPNGHVFVGTQNAPSGNGIYKSINNGDAFLLIQSGGTDVTMNSAFAAYAGTVFLVGGYVSLDSGGTWTAVNPSTNDGTALNPNTGVVNPVSSTRALMSSDIGTASTNNLTNGATSSWDESNEGLEGLIVNGLGQAAANKDRVLFATKSGLAFSDNFTDSSPTWTYPIIPLSNGSPARDAEFDPSDADRVFAGYSGIYEGEISVSGSVSINWTEVATSDPTNTFMSVKELTAFDSTLVAAFRQDESTLYGRLRFYDISSGGFSVDKTVLEGKPVNSFARVNDNIMFAGVGSFANLTGATSTTNRGVWISTDGGDTWTQMTSSDIAELEEAIVSKLAYDAINDVLYAASEDLSTEDTNEGSVFLLTNASTSSRNWTLPSSSVLDRSRQFRGVTVDPATGDVYASAGQIIYKSTNQGGSWSEYYVGLISEDTKVLYFDDLVQCSNAGCFAFADADLSSPTYALWNGFLGQTNILELVNKGESVVPVTVTLYDIDGDEQSETEITLAANSQQDLILNTILGFTENSYGVVKVEFDSTSVDGRLFYYRSLDGFVSNEFAYGIPFANAITGPSYVAFNTFQPSSNAADSGGEVYNWLSIVNLDTDSSRSFTVTRYSLSGEELNSTSVSVPAFGRVDLDGGHGEGPSVVGYNVITPASSTAPYKAQLIRYGYLSADRYSFAFPLIAQSAGGVQQWAGISSGAGAQDWLEVQNVTSESVDVTINFYDNQGNEVSEQDYSLASRSGVHIEASALLPAGASGATRITSDTPGAIIAQSMFYFRDSTGSIEAMYGLQSANALSGTNWGTWNLFLGMYNWLRVFNTSTSSQSFTVTVFHGSDSTETSVSLGGRSGVDLGLHEIGTYGTNLNNYGLVSIDGESFTAELLRLRPTTSGGIDFAAPTAIR